MKTPLCAALLLTLLVLQLASPSAGAPARRTLSADSVAEGGGATRRGRGRYDYVYECAKCDEESTDIGATVYAYDG
ncbi:hypothetical protein V5799_026826 [Amblyomma americanum]|uniref:Secreted protein n=1 Tax=Amblyomma americanum TaxID=6943 RepID=A0AAQ4DHG0_AMBAM